MKIIYNIILFFKEYSTLIAKLINLMAFNMLGLSVTGWLLSFWENYTIILATLTGLSLLVINVMKVRGMYIDQKIKLKELNKK